MLTYSFPRVAGLLSALFLCIQAPAQVTPENNPIRESVIAHVNRQAVLARAGDASATLELAHQMFLNAGIPIEVADSFGFTGRIIQAETDYRNQAHPATHEADIVKAVNNLTSTIGAPQWVNTNPAEVRKLRMHMLAAYPQLLASHEPPDAKGHRKAVSENLSPMEAAYVATHLLYQKAFNADYQFTSAEVAQNKKLDAATVKAKHLERTQAFQDLLQGKSQSISVRDLLTASDRFYGDLGIPPTTYMGSLKSTISNELTVIKRYMSRKTSAIVIAGLGVFGLIGIRKRLPRGPSFYVSLTLITVLTIGLSGCCFLLNNCPVTASVPTAGVLAQLSTSAGFIAWQNANVDVNVEPNSFNCSGNSPCTLGFKGVTNTSGIYSWSSWAIPGSWDVAAAVDSNCSTGANSGYVPIQGQSQINVVCGVIYGSYVVSSPSSCYYYYYEDTDTVNTNCPASITLTSSSAVFPTSHAMSVEAYDDTGTAQGSSSSISASSTTTITIPTPGYSGSSGSPGDNVIIVVDPSTNEIVGATLFTWNYVIYATNPRG
jgi:hypothetical protein